MPLWRYLVIETDVINKYKFNIHNSVTSVLYLSGVCGVLKLDMFIIKFVSC